jgi:tRNA1Val (adenine37-N6)-methyltransferase
MNTNELYTYNYSQPEEYHFSLDSIFLAQKVAKIYKTHPQLNSVNCLDLCAGTGVIGLELSIYLNDIKNIDFIEVQSEYLGHFENNFHGIHGLNSDRNFKYYQKNYEVVLTENNSIHFNKYDLILCNPPYFFSNEGILSPSNFKNRCRFFFD